MKTNVYSIYDCKSETYSNPILHLNDKTFIRSVVKTLDDNQGEYAEYPHDYTVFKIGIWSDRDASFQSLDTKEPLGTINDIYIANKVTDIKEAKAQ